MSKRLKRTARKKSRKRIVIIAVVIILVVIVICVINIGKWFKDNQKTSEMLSDINQAITVNNDAQNELDKYDVDFAKLKKMNSDTVAWFKINNTKIEYPVVKAEDNDYYLDKSFDRTINGAGWPFADYMNKFNGTDKNIVIYGHNRRDGSMFGTLRDTQNEEWYNNEENYIIPFITENEKALYQVFSVYTIEVEDYYIKTQFSKKDYSTFIEKMKERSVKDFGVEVSGEDQIFTLSTCAGSNYRVVLHAKKLQSK